ncbi:hypothetical protein [Actinomadura verrucosospora]
MREGDHRAAVNAALAEPLDGPAGAYLLLTAVFWRSGFKYGDFSYRLQCQEVGALAAQARAVAERDGTIVQTYLRFDDHALTGLLGLDPEAEGLLAVLSLPQVPASARLLRARTFPARTAVPARPARPAVSSPPVAGLLPHLVALHRAAGARAPAPTRSPEPASQSRSGGLDDKYRELPPWKDLSRGTSTLVLARAGSVMRRNWQPGPSPTPSGRSGLSFTRPPAATMRATVEKPVTI